MAPFSFHLFSWMAGPSMKKTWDIDKFMERGWQQTMKMTLHNELYQFEAMWDVDRYESDSDEMYEDDIIDNFHCETENFMLDIACTSTYTI
jgi:hypothetical protein